MAESRTGRRIHVRARYGRLIHEIRLSCAGDLWQARIVTLPRQIWVEPGGKKAVTFEAGTPERAESLAAEFIQRDCIARGHRPIEPVVEGGEIALEPARRLAVQYPIRYVQQGALLRSGGIKKRASTLNLSETGLFIATDEPFFPGSKLAIDLALPGNHERLDGRVIWSRMAAQYGNTPGMGVRLIEPPFSYRSRIQSLDRPAAFLPAF